MPSLPRTIPRKHQRKAEREGKIYTQRLLQKEIEEAQRKIRKAKSEANGAMPTIYSDRLTQYSELLGFDDEIDSHDLNADFENAADSGIIKCKDFNLSIDSKQFGKKLGKHAADYNLDPASEKDREEFLDVVVDIIANASEVASGSWRGQPEDVVFYIKGADVVVTKQNGEFITVLKGGINNARIKIARIR